MSTCFRLQLFHCLVPSVYAVPHAMSQAIWVAILRMAANEWFAKKPPCNMPNQNTMSFAHTCPSEKKPVGQQQRSKQLLWCILSNDMWSRFNQKWSVLQSRCCVTWGIRFVWSKGTAFWCVLRMWNVHSNSPANPYNVAREFTGIYQLFPKLTTDF